MANWVSFYFLISPRPEDVVFTAERKQLHLNTNCLFLPNQPVMLKPECITAFRHQIKNVANNPDVRNSPEALAAVETWVNDVGSTPNLSHGAIISAKLLDVRIRYMYPAALVGLIRCSSLSFSFFSISFLGLLDNSFQFSASRG